LDYDKFKSRDAKVTESDGIIGNVFDGFSVVTAFSEASLDGVTYSYEEVMSATLADRIEYKNVSLYLAGQFRTNEVTSASGDSFDKNAFNPTVAVAYKPVDSVSVYASYAESYTRPLEVSASYDNAGEIFEPIKNKQYALPFEVNPKFMAVNKTLLLDEGFSVPPDNWTWEDFYQICKSVTQDINGDGRNDIFGVCNYSWLDAVTSNGASLFDENRTHVSLNDNKVITAVKFMQKLNDLNPVKVSQFFGL